MTRGGWVEATLPVWQELAEPVATSIADALTDGAAASRRPTTCRASSQGAGRLMRTVGGSLFASQLGQVVGDLSKEVVSGGDVGIPIMPDGDRRDPAAELRRLRPRPRDPRRPARAVRRHRASSRTRACSATPAGCDCTSSRRSPTSRAASTSTPTRSKSSPRASTRPSRRSCAAPSRAARCCPTRSEAQNAALTRLENLLATIEGWVDVVTENATSRLPSADRIAEAVRRRRAVGGPAERRSARSSVSSCGRAACARPPRCGER